MKKSEIDPRSSSGLEENLKKVLTELLILFLFNERDHYIGELSVLLKKNHRIPFISEDGDLSETVRVLISKSLSYSHKNPRRKPLSVRGGGDCFLILISNEILSFETRTLRVLAVLRTAPSHTKLDALRAIKNESFLTSFRIS